MAIISLGQYICTFLESRILPSYWYLCGYFKHWQPFFILCSLLYTQKSCVYIKQTSPFLDLDLSINNGIILSKIYDKQDDFDFAIHVVNYPHPDGDVPRATSYGVYILQLIGLLGPVPLLKMSIFVIERSLKKLLKLG